LFANPKITRYITDEVEVYLTDATFDVAPRNFEQVLTVCAEIGGYVTPVFTALMSSKSALLYTKVFQVIKEKFPAVNPKFFCADFEASISIAIQEVFPQAVEKGCCFHYKQAVTRQLRSPGIYSNLK